jgi:hypothetical protein
LADAEYSKGIQNMTKATSHLGDAGQLLHTKRNGAACYTVSYASTSLPQEAHPAELLHYFNVPAALSRTGCFNPFLHHHHSPNRVSNCKQTPYKLLTGLSPGTRLGMPAAYANHNCCC